MLSDDQLKEYLDSKFQSVYEKMDHMNDSLVKDIVRLQENDNHHFKLDRDHREICANNRTQIKTDLDESLSRFGERLGNQEQTSAVQEARIGTLEKNYVGDKGNLQEWIRTLFPYIIIVAGFIYIQFGTVS